MVLSGLRKWRVWIYCKTLWYKFTSFEVFTDRNYNDDGTLVSRMQENAVIGWRIRCYIKSYKFKDKILFKYKWT